MKLRRAQSTRHREIGETRANLVVSLYILFELGDLLGGHASMLSPKLMEICIRDTLLLEEHLKLVVCTSSRHNS